ncbi:hypothetical protein [Amylibacter sp. IMCC11727]|uniref:COG4223 family protein n=1 Tax=Amylibacter sp. IMCC11727 TaxID=3039851 RepID=UPI00244D9ADC|nr:hypothetical protein [Amylibacter sp. IMCC11727]WGI21980.1 hypothetical protein QBD29_00760 [Amylibacter sp. IMCC11727]
MAKKSTKSTKIEDAEVVETTAADDGVKVVEETTETITEEIVEDSTDEPTTDAEAEDTLTEEEEVRASLSSRVLRGLFLIFVGIAIALWGAPKLAPLLPAGLSPVAEFLMPGQSEAKSEIAALRADLDDRLAAIPTTSGVDQKAIDDAIAAYAASQAEEMAAIKDALAATDGQDIEARIASLESQVQGLNAELSAVGERLSLQITENGATLSEEAASKLSGYQAVLEGLKAQVADLAAKNGALSQKIEEAEKASARRIEEAQEEASTKVANTATKKNLTDIAAALDSGAPFQAALDALTQVADATIPAGLSAVAENGTPSWTTLRNGFSDAAHNALRADIEAKAKDGSISKIGAFFKTQVGSRSLERKEGPETDAILSRVEDDLVNRRLNAALTEANSLPDAAKTAMSSWIANLAALNAAQSDLKDLSAALGAN